MSDNQAINHGIRLTQVLLTPFRCSASQIMSCTAHPTKNGGGGTSN